MHHLTCGISLHSVNLIVFTLLLVHLILRISPHHSHHLRSHHLSLPRPFTPDLKLISFTNPFLHTYIAYIYEIYNALHSRGWLESEARAVARWRGLGKNGREVECF